MRRLYACEEELLQRPPGTPLGDEVVSGKEGTFASSARWPFVNGGGLPTPEDPSQKGRYVARTQAGRSFGADPAKQDTISQALIKVEQWLVAFRNTGWPALYNSSLLWIS